MALLNPLVVGVIAIVALYLWYRYKLKHMHDLTDHMPGIRRLPWRAMIRHLTSRNKGSKNNYTLYNVVEKIVAPFPEINKGWVGPFLLIDIRSPEYVKKVLNSDKCIDRADFYTFPYKTGLLLSGGELWKRHRKILNPAFSSNKLNKFMPIINSKARKLSDVLSDYAGKDSFNIVRLLSALTLESLLQTSFGLEKDFINNPFDRFFAIVKKEAVAIGNNISNMFILFIPKAYRENEFTEYCKNIRIEAEQEKSDTFNTSNQNFISILLANKKYLTDLEIQDEVSTMILSGNASTALSMSSALLMLATHQDVQEKVVEELRSVFYDFDEDIDSDSLNKLEYLDLVVKETLRLFPVAPIIGRKATADVQLDDKYTLPKGANLVLRIFDIHRNPDYWGNDAHKFNPDRFLPENISKIHQYAFIPFSGGARICIGYRYALNAMKIVLCHILRNYRVTSPLKYEDLTLEISFVLRISQNYLIKLEKRNSS